MFASNDFPRQPPNLVGRHLALITIITQFYNLQLQELRNYVEKLISALLSKLAVSGLATAYQWLILTYSGNLSVYCSVLLYKRVSKIHAKNACDPKSQRWYIPKNNQIYPWNKNPSTWKYVHQDQPHMPPITSQHSTINGQCKAPNECWLLMQWALCHCGESYQRRKNASEKDIEVLVGEHVKQRDYILGHSKGCPK